MQLSRLGRLGSCVRLASCNQRTPILVGAHQPVSAFQPGLQSQPHRYIHQDLRKFYFRAKKELERVARDDSMKEIIKMIQKAVKIFETNIHKFMQNELVKKAIKEAEMISFKTDRGVDKFTRGMTQWRGTLARKLDPDGSKPPRYKFNRNIKISPMKKGEGFYERSEQFMSKIVKIKPKFKYKDTVDKVVAIVMRILSVITLVVVTTFTVKAFSETKSSLNHLVANRVSADEITKSVSSNHHDPTDVEVNDNDGDSSQKTEDTNQKLK